MLFRSVTNNDENFKQMGVNQMLSTCLVDLYSGTGQKCTGLQSFIEHYDKSNANFIKQHPDDWEYVSPDMVPYDMSGETIPESACAIREKYAKSNDSVDSILFQYTGGAMECQSDDRTTNARIAAQMAISNIDLDVDFDVWVSNVGARHKELVQDFLDMGIERRGFAQAKGKWVDASTVSFEIGDTNSSLVPKENVKIVFDVIGKPWDVADVTGISRNGTTVTFTLKQSFDQSTVKSIYMLPTRVVNALVADNKNLCHERAKKFIAELVYYFDASKLSTKTQKWVKKVKLCLGHLIRTGEDFCFINDPEEDTAIPAGLEDVDFSVVADGLDQAEYKRLLKEAHAKMGKEFQPLTLDNIESRFGAKRMANMRKMEAVVAEVSKGNMAPEAAPSWYSQVDNVFEMFGELTRQFRVGGDYSDWGLRNNDTIPTLQPGQTYPIGTKFTTRSAGETSFACEINDKYICVDNEEYQYCPWQKIGAQNYMWLSKYDEGGNIIDCRPPTYYSTQSRDGYGIYLEEHLPTGLV